MGNAAGRTFEFDSAEMVAAEKPYRDNSAIYAFVVEHLAAVNVSLLGIRAMLWVMDGGANALLYRAVYWYFGPLMDGLRW